MTTSLHLIIATMAALAASPAAIAHARTEAATRSISEAQPRTFGILTPADSVRSRDHPWRQRLPDVNEAPDVCHRAHKLTSSSKRPFWPCRQSDLGDRRPTQERLGREGASGSSLRGSSR